MIATSQWDRLRYQVYYLPKSSVQLTVTVSKPTYRIRKLKNKGAIVILVWNLLIGSVFDYLTAFVASYGLKITTVALGLTLPFAGWLADIRFGRYKVIR